MRLLRGVLFLLAFILVSEQANSQVLISILFGDKLNSDKIEFGLIGGMNRSYINDISSSKGLNNFNLGFYFHINLKNTNYLSTGVLVKSNVGATGMPTYPIGDPDFDEVFDEGTLTKKISYFYVPIMFHKRLNQNRWYLEGGIQAGLRNVANDNFKVDEYGGEVSYKRNVKDQYGHFDFGFIGGAGYKFKKVIKSLSAGINYYYGVVNVSKVADTPIKNSSIYFYLKIPIGAGHSESAPPQN